MEKSHCILTLMDLICDNLSLKFNEIKAKKDEFLSLITIKLDT